MDCKPSNEKEKATRPRVLSPLELEIPETIISDQYGINLACKYLGRGGGEKSKIKATNVGTKCSSSFQINDSKELIRPDAVTHFLAC